MGTLSSKKQPSKKNLYVELQHSYTVNNNDNFDTVSRDIYEFCGKNRLIPGIIPGIIKISPRYGEIIEFIVDEFCAVPKKLNNY